MSAAVYMLFLLLFMTANLMPQAKQKQKYVHPCSRP